MTCNHNYIPTDPQWMRCEKCGEIKPLNTMKKLLFALLILLVACKTSKPVKTNVGLFTPDSSGVLNALYIRSYPPDTIPVIIYAVDTTLRGMYVPLICINGYSVGRYNQTYLNVLKQPLPERLIVWMAVRRKER